MAEVLKISEAFGKGRAALMPCFTIGYPDYVTSLDLVEACVGAGELGSLCQQHGLDLVFFAAAK